VSYNLGTASGTIRITYDSSGVARAVAGVDSLEAKLKALESVSADIHVNDAAARIELERIRAEIADLSKQVADPKVRIDEAEAQVKIAALTTELTRLDGSTVRVNVRADTKPALTNVQQFRESMFSVLRIGIALSPALVPVMAEIAGGAAAMAGAFGAAGIGIGAFAGAMALNLQNTVTQVKALSKAQSDYDKALAAGDKAGQLKAFVDMQTALAQMSPQERAVAQGFQDMKAQAQGAAATIKPQTFTIVGEALDAIRNIIRALTPLLAPMANAFVIIGARIKEITASDEFQSFFAGIADAAGQITVALGGAFLNIFHALAGVIRELVPYGVQFAQLLLQWTQRLGDAANTTQFSDAIAKFFAYVRDNGPVVGAFLKLIVENLVGLGKSAAPLGPVILDIVNVLLQLTGAVLNSPFGPYVLGLVSIGLAAKSVAQPIKDVIDTAETVSNTVEAIGGSADALKELSSGGQKAVTALRGVGSAAADLGGKIKSAATAGADFVKNMAAVGRANAAAAMNSMKSAASSLATSIGSVAKSIGKSLISGLVSLATTLYAGAAAAWAFIAPWLPWIALAAAIGVAIYVLYRNWNTVWNGIKAVFGAVVDFVVAHWKLLIAFLPVIGPILALILNNWRTIWNAIKAVTGAVIGFVMAIVRTGMAVVQAVISGAINAARAVWGAVWGAISGIASGAVGAILGAVNRVFAIAGIFASALGAALGAVRGGIGSIIGAFGGLWGAIKGAIGDLYGNALGLGASIVQGFVDGIRNGWHMITDTIGGLASHLPGPVKKILGINSPSKVFAEIGAGIPEGMALGIDRGAVDVMKTLHSLMNTVALTPAPVNVMAPPSGGGGGNVNVSFNFGDIASPAAAAAVREVVTDQSVLSKITNAARAGVRAEG
jgi:phage-related protein